LLDAAEAELKKCLNRLLQIRLVLHGYTKCCSQGDQDETVSENTIQNTTLPASSKTP
jgi:hypothetical protein